jgi:hypothetical protein
MLDEETAARPFAFPLKPLCTGLAEEGDIRILLLREGNFPRAGTRPLFEGMEKSDIVKRL